MNKFSFLGPFRWVKRLSKREVGILRRSRWSFRSESLQPLETRQLLAGSVTMSETFSAAIPLQTTDYTATVSLPKFDNTLGTLTSVNLSVTAGGVFNGTVTNNGTDPQALAITEDIDLPFSASIDNASTTLVDPQLHASQAFPELEGGGGVGVFGPFTPTDTDSTTLTTGPSFELFRQGTGNVDLTLATNTTQSSSGGGGNIASALGTSAGAIATVTYQYSIATVSLSGHVYDDLNGTGALASGDPPIPGTILSLLNASGTVVATTATLPDGTYSFSTDSSGNLLLAGTYSVAETQPAGFLQGTNTVGTVNGVTDGALTGLDVIGSIVLGQGQDSINNNFGEVLPVGLAGTVYDDVTGGGKLQPGDTPIGGVTLSLFNASGLVATTTTDVFGNYSFTTTSLGAPLPPGTYTLVETQPTGYLQGSNTVGTVNGVTDGVLGGVDIISTIGLNSGQASLQNNFGEVLPVGLAGTVYDDVTGGGKLQPGDTPIGGVTLSLFNASGLVATTTTDVFGNYSFTTTSLGAPLPPGTYTLVETQPTGYLQGSNTVGTVNGVTDGVLGGVDIISTIGLNSGQASLQNNFGEVLPVGLAGTVYDDVTGGGKLQPGDTPIGGVTLSLFDASGLVATTTTDVFGNYSFTTTSLGAPLPPGTYTLVETQPTGYLQGSNTVGTVNGVTVGTLPTTDVIGSIILTSGQASLRNNFGEILPTPPPSPIPPNVIDVQRFGVHLQPTLIVLSFDIPLNTATASNPANYQVYGPTDSKHPALVPVESAVYNPVTNMVTLHLAARLDVHHPYRLTVNGIQSTSGALLVGSNGVAGSSFVTTLNRSNLSGFTDIYGNFIPINHGKLYPAAIASGYQLKRFNSPSNLGSFAQANKAVFLAATAGMPQTPPIDYRSGKKLPKVKHS